MMRRPHGWIATGLLLALAGTGWGKTLNGNDFALYYSEAKTDEARKALIAESKGNPHYFRYLQIMELGEKEGPRGSQVYITAFEPSSYMDVKFLVTKNESLKKLSEEPRSKKGDAIAITGVVQGVDKNTILVEPVIVRHKDKLTPGRGKEMFYEIDASGRFYSFTGGKQEVVLTYQDRDLLQYKDEIMAKNGENWKDAWTEFLQKEVAKRDKERKDKQKAYKQEQKAEKVQP